MKFELTENFHTHTPRCGHACGSEREYIEAAIENGIKVLGFSDHIPVPKSVKAHILTNMRMSPLQAEDYVQTLRALKEEYKEKIKIYIGYEGEYLEEFFDEQMELIDSLGYDYLIMGQHFTPDLLGYYYCGLATLSEKKLKQYVDCCIKGLKTGRYLYLAHPDLSQYVGNEKIYDREMRRLCQFCKENNIPLEINIHGLLEDRFYPSVKFFKIAVEVGNQIVLGLDCHNPNEIPQAAHSEKISQFLDQCHITELTNVSTLLKKK